MSDSINTKELVPCANCMRGNGDNYVCNQWHKCQPSGEARLFIQQGKEEDAAAGEEKAGLLRPGRWPAAQDEPKQTSDGSTASYYELPTNATELQDLISHRNMNAQIGEIFRACYRYGIASHSNQLRDAKKIKFYAEAEIARLEVAERLSKYENKQEGGNKP